MHLVDFCGKCRQIYHTWILWVLDDDKPLLENMVKLNQPSLTNKDGLATFQGKRNMVHVFCLAMAELFVINQIILDSLRWR